MQIKTVEAGRGAAWLLDGFDYFKREPVNWIVVTVLLFVIALVLKWIPLGELVFQVLSPVFVAGLMLGCKAQDEGGKLEVSHLIAAFSGTAVSQLVLVGVLYFVGLLAIVIVAVAGMALFGVGAGQLAGLLQSGDATHISFNLGLFLVPILVAIGASVPLLMAVWFAPVLVVLANLTAIEALKQSFAGCLANVVPFLVYGLVGLVLAVLASIPLGLGWLILLPMITASVYIGYKEIFIMVPSAQAA